MRCRTQAKLAAAVVFHDQQQGSRTPATAMARQDQVLSRSRLMRSRVSTATPVPWQGRSVSRECSAVSHGTRLQLVPPGESSGRDGWVCATQTLRWFHTPVSVPRQQLCLSSSCLTLHEAVGDSLLY